jgi:polyisoprenoid-binding protein YceI
MRPDDSPNLSRKNSMINASNAQRLTRGDPHRALSLLQDLFPAAVLIAVLGQACQLRAAPAPYPLQGKAVYAATSTMSDWTGTNPKVSGTAIRDEAAKTVEAKVSIDLSGWDSGSALRDKHTATMFETDKFPQATFTGTAASGASTNVLFKGTLELHGVKRDLDVPGALRMEKEGLAFNGDFVLKLTDFGMKQPSMLGVTVGNEIKVHIDATTSSK